MARGPTATQPPVFAFLFAVRMALEREHVCPTAMIVAAPAASGNPSMSTTLAASAPRAEALETLIDNLLLDESR